MMTLRSTTCAVMLLLGAALHHAACAQARVTAPAGASQGERQAVQWFNMLDRNGDGRLTRDEAKWAFRLDPRLEQQFDQADTNHDGIVTAAEIRALAARRKAERVARRSAASANRAADAPPAAPRP